ALRLKTLNPYELKTGYKGGGPDRSDAHFLKSEALKVNKNFVGLDSREPLVFSSRRSFAAYRRD
ncbi:MAG: hypothetical protein ACETVR_02175, partial [Candidatus Bathyarchaeia archaeon]